MGDWKVIVATLTKNYVLNPSAETTGNFAALAGTTVTRDSDNQNYGLYSYRVQSNADNEGMTLTLEALANLDHWITMRVSGTLPASWDVSLNDTNYHAPVLLEAIDTEWSLYGVEIPAAQANGSVILHIRQNGAGSGDFYIDGVQVEQTTFTTYTTYCDGTQPGCEWSGAAHASTSTRSANSRAGGRVYDLEDDYGLEITGVSGSGTSPQELFVDSYSQLPGGELNAIKTKSRIITLTAVIRGSNWADFHQKKQYLKSILSKDAVPQDQGGFQPIRLRYTGATAHKEIQVHYEGGLEGEIVAIKPCFWEDVAVRFIAPNPYWYEIGESATLLDTNDSDTFRTVAGRLRSTGQWDNLGPPNASGTYASVRALAEDATYIYIGGDFLNFDNIAAADYIVRYHKATGVYSALDVGLNGIVRALAIRSNGDLYIGGDFTNAGGVAAADYLAVWNGTVFAAVGTPLTGAAAITKVQALAIDASGNLYIGGLFANWNNIANADNIVKWNGSVYSALSTGTDDEVLALAVGIDGVTIFAGGFFNNAGGGLVENITSWNGTAFSSLSTGSSGLVFSLAVDPATGLVYVGGAFTSLGGVVCNSIGVWNGTSFLNLGGGITPSGVDSIAVGTDGVVYIGGTFTAAGGITLADRIARWNGYAWSHLDVDLPGSARGYSILASRYADPVVPQKYNLYLGFDTTGTGTYAGIETVSNSGTVPAYPKIIFNRSGGTTATIQAVRNERNGQEILFNYALLDGETLTIDLAQTKKSISSSFFGSRQGAVLPNSDFGSFALLPGNNDITSFVSTTGSPTVTAWVLFKDAFDSQD